MKNFIVYLSTGQIVRAGSCQAETFELQKGDGEYLLEGVYTGNQYIVNGQIVGMPPKPQGEYVFNYDLRTWVFNAFSATQQAYARRTQLLNDLLRY